MTTTKKIIAIISPEYSGNKLFDGGLASFLDKFINLIGSDYDVHLITPSKNNKITNKKNFILHEVKLNFFIKIIKFTKIKLLIYLFYYPLQSFILNNYLKKITYKPDIYFYTNFEYVSLFQPNNINSIVRISSFDQIWFQRGLLSKSLSKIYDYIVLNKCDQIWSTSNFISRYIDKKFNKKIVYTPPFINYSTKYKLKKTLQKIKNRNFLLFIGTISERKGVHLLKELFLEIYKRDKKYKFVIIGRDTKNYFTSTYRKYFDNQTFSKNCIYFKVKKKKFFFPLIKYADAVIIPSLVETSPNILQEVLINNGIPICSNNTSMEELLKNDQNFLFKNNDVDDLVKKTLKLLLNDKNKLLKKIKVFKKMLYAKERQEIILKNLSVLLK